MSFISVSQFKSCCSSLLGVWKSWVPSDHIRLTGSILILKMDYSSVVFHLFKFTVRSFFCNNPFNFLSLSLCLSSRAQCEEDEALSLLQAADQRAGERVSTQHLHQQRQTYEAVPPSAPDRSVRACCNISFFL